MVIADTNDAGLNRGALIVDEGQKPGLQRLRQRLDILKHKRAAAGLLDQRHLAAFFHRTEKPGGQHLVAESRAADDDELLAGP